MSDIPDAEFYQTIAAIVGARSVVDASKSLNFFSTKFVTSVRDSGVEMSFGHVTKHPLPHMASYLANEYAKKNRGISDYGETHALLASEFESVKVFIDSTFKRLSNFYNAMTRADHFGPILQVKLENIIENPTHFLFRPTSKLLGVEPSDFDVDYWKTEIHPIGGNLGPLIQAKALKTGNIGSRRVVDRESIYSQRASLRQDDKWKHFLPGRVREYIQTHTTAQHLQSLLGYDEVHIAAVSAIS
ncbi:hypothetical protein AAFN47_06410 [Hoeflea sp. CAU 1731]